MVPSWTETLLEAGIDVVGRTRFCVHPRERVKAIPVLGGTKSWDLEKLRELSPDIVLLDREENPREMAEQSPFPVLDTHVDSLKSLASELDRLGESFSNESLKSWARELREILAKPPRSKFLPPPGVRGILGDPSPVPAARAVTYLIWRDPWMAAGRGTFIASLLEFLGAEIGALPKGKYPRLDDASLRSSSSILLFSSEPYPFEKKRDEIEALGLNGYLVDGEAYGWFGIRALRFLQSVFGTG